MKTNKIISIIGRKGDGKTTLAKFFALKLSKPVIVINPALEFEKNKQRIFFNSFFACVDFLKLHRKEFLKSRLQLVINNLDETKKVNEFALQLEKLDIKNIVLLCDETDLYADNRLAKNDKFFKLVYLSRNKQIDLIFISKKPALISKLILSQSDIILVSKLHENRDLEYFHRRDKRLVEKIKALEKYEFLVDDGLMKFEIFRLKNNILNTIGA